MKKSIQIQAILDEYIPHPTIALEHTDPFTLLIATLLSAQCTDARVNIVTRELFKVANTPEKMAALSEDEILKMIRSCGLAPTKAKACKKLALILLEKHHSKVPCSFEQLEELPGVGHKTASVVMAQAFNVPTFPVDTHIFRAAHRWGISKGKTVEKAEADLKKYFPRKNWNRLHLQIILFCRAYCPARNHSFENCPMCRVVVSQSTRRG